MFENIIHDKTLMSTNIFFNYYHVMNTMHDKNVISYYNKVCITHNNVKNQTSCIIYVNKINIIILYL